MTAVYTVSTAALFVDSKVLKTMQISINRGLVRYTTGQSHSMEYNAKIYKRIEEIWATMEKSRKVLSERKKVFGRVNGPHFCIKKVEKG